MRPTVLFVLLLAASASARPGRSARLLVQAEPTPLSEQPSPTVLVPPTSPGVAAPPAFRPAPRDRTLKLLLGLGTGIGVGLLVPGAVATGGILVGLTLTVMTAGAFNPFWGLAPAVVIAWVVAPLAVALVMDGFRVPVRAVVGALAGAAVGALVLALSWATPVALLGWVLGAGGPCLGEIAALHFAPDEAFLPPSGPAPLAVSTPVVPLVSARF